jgi:hypothetical protein
MLMTRARYASHRGCDLKAVTLALETNRIHAEPSGLIESTRADREWDANTDVMRSRILPRESPSARRSSGAAAPVAATVQGERQPVTLRYLEQRTEQARVMVEAKRLDMDIRKRMLVPYSEMEEAAKRIYGEVRALRDACLEIPDRLSSGLAVETEAHKVREILWRELISIFDRFAAENDRPVGEAAA